MEIIAMSTKTLKILRLTTVVSKRGRRMPLLRTWISRYPNFLIPIYEAAATAVRRSAKLIFLK
jgi:hypothetical protein